MNNIKTLVLMAGLMGLFLLAGQLLGGSQGLMLALILGSAFNFIMYFFSDKIVLRMYGAQVVTEEQAPELYRHGGPAASAGRTARCRSSPWRRTSSPTRSPPAASPEPRGGRGDDGHSQVHAAGGARGRDRPRAGARQEPRHADHHDRRRSRRRDQQPAVPAHVRRRPRRRRRPPVRPARAAAARADRRDADPVRGLAPAGVRGGPGRRGDPGPADAAGERAAPAGRPGTPDSDGGGAGRGAAGPGQPAGRPRRRLARDSSAPTRPPKSGWRGSKRWRRAGKWVTTASPSGWASPASSWPCWSSTWGC